MFQTLHTHCISLSIAGIRLFVECGLQPGPSLDPLQQLRLSPAVLLRGPEIPGTLPATLTALQNGRILRPAQLQSQRQEVWVAGVGPAERPHPAQVSGREALGLRVVCLEILSSHHCRTLLRSCTDSPANLKVQFYLRQFALHQNIQGCVHCGIVNRLSLVHRLILSGVLPQPESRKGKGGGTAALSLTAFCYRICTICSHRRICLVSMALLSW